MKIEAPYDHGCHTRKSSSDIQWNISRTWVEFLSTPPGLTHLLGHLSPNPGESAEQARRRFYRRMFGILWLSLTRYQYPSQPSFEASHNAHSLRWKTRLLASMVSSLEPMAIGASFEEIIKRVAKCQKCLCIVPRKPFS